MEAHPLTGTIQQVATALDATIGFLTDLGHTYRCATVTVKRQINRAMFEQILVDADDPASGDQQQLYRQFLASNLLTAARAYAGRPDDGNGRSGKPADARRETELGPLRAARLAGV